MLVPGAPAVQADDLGKVVPERVDQKDRRAADRVNGASDHVAPNDAECDTIPIRLAFQCGTPLNDSGRATPAVVASRSASRLVTFNDWKP